MNALECIVAKAKQRKKRIALPEAGLDPRMIKAARLLADRGWATPLLIGEETKVKNMAAELETAIDDMAHIDHTTDARREEFAEAYREIRRKEQLSREQSLDIFNNPLYFGAMLVKKGGADGMTAGAYHSTADVLRPTIRIIGTAEGIKTVSSSIILQVPDCDYGEGGVIFFADPAILPDPSVRQLADIAISTADVAKSLLGIEPHVAMLSFSTYGSARHPKVDHVQQATELVRERRPELKVDGELQADAALVPSVGEKKCPGSPIAGKANVLIFPDLNAANIGYKLVARLAKADALGPISQGLALPVNDLSRGATIEEIAATVAITAAMG